MTTKPFTDQLTPDEAADFEAHGEERARRERDRQRTAGRRPGAGFSRLTKVTKERGEAVMADGWSKGGELRSGVLAQMVHVAAIDRRDAEIRALRERVRELEAQHDNIIANCRDCGQSIPADGGYNWSGGELYRCSDCCAVRDAAALKP